MSDDKVYEAPGYGGKDALMTKRKPTTIKDFKQLTAAIAALKELAPDLIEEIENIEGAVWLLGEKVSNTALILTQMVERQKAEQAIKAIKEADEATKQ